MDNNAAFERFKISYLAGSGLARLNPYPDDSQFLLKDAYTVETVKNENGILFLALVIARMDECGMREEILSLKARIRMTILSLQEKNGLYNRQPFGSRGRTEAHDNYVGIAFLCAYFDWPDLMQQVIDYAWAHAFCFNNVSPYKFKFTQLRQPGEMALYYFASKQTPAWFFQAWMAAGLVINSKDNDPGRKQLAWLRLRTLDQIKNQDGFKLHDVLDSGIDAWVDSFDRIFKGDIRNVFAKYFPAGHPIHFFTEPA